jgi:hypothetical protein
MRTIVFRLMAVIGLALASTPLVQAAPAHASSVTSIAFSGSTGTVTAGGVLYAREGGTFKLVVYTSPDTQCVDVGGAFTGHLTSATPRTEWIFEHTAGSGDGVQTVSASAWPAFDAGGCTGQAEASGSAAFVLDNTGPVLSAMVTPAPNAAGWANATASIQWTASDAGSGVASGPTPSTDGVPSDHNLVTKTATATDLLGNVGTGSVTVGVDANPPTISGSASPAPNALGWNNSDVTVSFTCGDKLSGVESCPEPATLTSSLADQSASGTAWDKAGNSASATAGGINIDKDPPTVSHSLSPAANANGWNRGNVKVIFSCKDDLSGVASCPAEQGVTSEGQGQPVGGTALDNAGNSASDSLKVNIDWTKPAISGAPTSKPNAGGWYQAPVTVHFTCSDQGTVQSGIDTCGPDVKLTAEGANQSATGSAVDIAGNSASATVSGIDIDGSGPTITGVSLPDKVTYILGDPAIPAGLPTCTASDSGSGLASCGVTVSGGQPNGVGVYNWTATATDNVGNTTTQTGSYRVIYAFSGFLQPINDTAHAQTCGSPCPTSIFKGGSAIPVKFQLRTVDGAIVQSNNAPQWLTPSQGAATTASVDESVYSAVASSGGAFRWDSTAQQYIYNWSTKGAATSGFYYQIGVTLDDGETYQVSIGLR